MTSEEILSAAFNNFRKLTMYSFRQVNVVGYKKPETNMEIFSNPYAELNIGKHKIMFQIEIKNEIRHMHIIPLLEKIGKRRDEWILVSQYIPGPIKDELRKYGMNYLEASGNCSIRVDLATIYVNNQDVAPSRKTTTKKLWNVTGLKFLFVILAEPKLLDEPYRKIAQCADISISNIKGYIDELADEGYIVNNNNTYIYKRKETLLKKWVSEFEITLFPKIFIGKYSFRDEEESYLDVDQRIENYYEKNEYGREQEIILGSEAAGNYWTRRLRPEKISIYTDGSKNEVERVLKLKPDKDGDVTLLYMFWSEQLNHVSSKNRNKKEGYFSPRYVHPLLAYAELIISGDSRNKEIADRIKEQFLS